MLVSARPNSSRKHFTPRVTNNVRIEDPKRPQNVVNDQGKEENGVVSPELKENSPVVDVKVSQRPLSQISKRKEK